MSFATPAALLMLGLSLPIVLLYVLKVRVRRVPVSTNLFWRQIYEEKPPRSVWQYLRHLVSLLLQLLLLLLLVLSVADPYFPWQLLQARRIVAVIDNSASMQADDIGPTRFQAAIDSATSLVDTLRFRDQMAILLSGPRPEVVLGMSSHVPTLKRALREISVADNPTALPPAIELGKRLIGEHPHGQIVVFSDACDVSLLGEVNERDKSTGTVAETEPSPSSSAESGPAEQPTQPAVDHRIFATRAANVGITQFQVRRSLIDPLGYQVLVAVLNASDVPVRCRLEIDLDDDPVDVVPLSLEADELWIRSIEKTSLDGGRIVGRLTDFDVADSSDDSTSSTDTDTSLPPEISRDDVTTSTRSDVMTEQASLNHLARDDVAYAILPRREVQEVLVVTKGNLFLRNVFKANPLVQVAVTADFPEAWPAEAIVVLDREVPETLPPNKLFVVDPVSDSELWQLGGLLQDPIVTEQDKDSPLMKHVRLDNVLMPEARKITINGNVRTLARVLSDDPVYAEIQREAGKKCLVLTVNLDKSDLAFRTAFPIMVTNALGWFAGTSGELREAVATGQTISFPSQDGMAESIPGVLELSSPSGIGRPVARPRGPLPTDGTTDSDTRTQEAFKQRPWTLGPFDEAGIWLLQRAPSDEDTSDSAAGRTLDIAPTDSVGPIAEFAVNVANRRETDLRPPGEMLSADESQPLASGLLTRPIWFYLIAFGCLLSMTEWFLYQRRMIS